MLYPSLLLLYFYPLRIRKEDLWVLVDHENTEDVTMTCDLQTFTITITRRLHGHDLSTWMAHHAGAFHNRASSGKWWKTTTVSQVYVGIHMSAHTSSYWRRLNGQTSAVYTYNGARCRAGLAVLIPS